MDIIIVEDIMKGIPADNILADNMTVDNILMENILWTTS